MDENIYLDCLNEKELNGAEYWDRLAKKYNKDKEQLRGEFRREVKRRSKSTESKNKETQVVNTIPQGIIDVQELKDDGTVTSDKLIEICEEDIKKPEKLLELHGFDSALWEIVSCKNSRWHGQTPEGVRIFYQSRLVCKPVFPKENITFEDINRFFKNLSPIEESIYNKIDLDYSNKIVEIDIADFHIGDRFINKEKIVETVEKIFVNIIEKLVNIRPKKIYLVLLGDILHYDTIHKTTTSGTQLDTNEDTIYETFEIAMRFFIDIINKLMKISDLEVIGIYGNHDKISSFFLVKSLEYYFGEKIIVDSDHKSRKYRKIGSNLVGWLHGSDISKDHITSWLYSEARAEWGVTKYAECHASHLHHQLTIEKNGIILRHISAIAPVDNWSYDKGFISSNRAITSFVWDEDRGLEEIWFENLNNGVI